MIYLISSRNRGYDFYYDCETGMVLRYDINSLLSSRHFHKIGNIWYPTTKINMKPEFTVKRSNCLCREYASLKMSSSYIDEIILSKILSKL